MSRYMQDNKSYLPEAMCYLTDLLIFNAERNSELVWYFFLYILWHPPIMGLWDLRGSSSGPG